MEAIKESISQMTESFHSKLAKFEERQLKMSAPSSPDAVTLGAEFSIFKDFVIGALRALQCQVDILARSTDSLEMHRRRKVLLLHGITEDKTTDVTEAVVDVVVNRLNIHSFRAEEITHCYRMGRASATGKPRPILFKLQDFTARSKIWAAKKNLKSSGITLSEFLTKPRHDTFLLARQRFGITRTWTHEGHIFVLGAGGVRNRVSCMAELDKLGRQDDPVVSSKQPAVPVAGVKEHTVKSKPRRAASTLRK